MKKIILTLVLASGFLFATVNSTTAQEAPKKCCQSKKNCSDKDKKECKDGKKACCKDKKECKDKAEKAPVQKPSNEKE